LLYQNKTEEALKRLRSFYGSKKVDMFDDSVLTDRPFEISLSIMDDVYWLEANLRMKQGEFTESIALLQKILIEYPDDILSDDAYFLQGEIYELHLKEKERAMEIYREFLNKYPGSVYAAEARKRFRNLRGDFTDQKTIVN
jgi:tetratricopeptide (TPR) repeat protein